MIATLLSPRRRNNRGRQPEGKFDCGKFGRLSRSQIAAVAGISTTAAAQRINNGWKGERLCAPKRSGNYHKRGKVCRSTMVIAAKIARQFPDRVPSIKEIVRVHPMAESTARNWQTVFHTLQEAA
jgi:hypothetical protein